jgi:hypothetical protein
LDGIGNDAINKYHHRTIAPAQRGTGHKKMARRGLEFQFITSKLSQKMVVLGTNPTPSAKDIVIAFGT